MDLAAYVLTAWIIGWHVADAAVDEGPTNALTNVMAFMAALLVMVIAGPLVVGPFVFLADPRPAADELQGKIMIAGGCGALAAIISLAKRSRADAREERRRMIEASGQLSGGPATHHVQSQYGQKLEELGALPPGPEVPEWRALWLSDLDLELNRAAFAIRREAVREGRARRHIDHSSARSAATTCNVWPWWMAPLAAALLGASAFAAFTAIEFYDDHEPGAAFLSLLPIIALHRIWRTAPVLALLRQASRDASLEDVLIRNGVIWYRMR